LSQEGIADDRLDAIVESIRSERPHGAIVVLHTGRLERPAYASHEQFSSNMAQATIVQLTSCSNINARARKRTLKSVRADEVWPAWSA
jgi:hypothetical protein